MVLKDLPEEYKLFVTTQSEKYETFREFRVALWSLQDMMQANIATGTHSVMKTELNIRKNARGMSSFFNAPKQGILLISVIVK